LQRDGSQGTVVIILIVVIGRMEDAPVTPLFGPGLAASLATTLFFGHWFQKHHVLPVDGMTRSRERAGPLLMLCVVVVAVRGVAAVANTTTWAKTAAKSTTTTVVVERISFIGSLR
jgi:uncharacterized lipoprotein NlpE involved in copper resistance